MVTTVNENLASSEIMLAVFSDMLKHTCTDYVTELPKRCGRDGFTRCAKIHKFVAVVKCSKVDITTLTIENADVS